ncbi:MAG TPA: hypothetical protein VHJ77_05245 [Vicinamibacterales bacterium]|jgi:hypothetical protein|nr:hypothetical protein [Vicinamibacterales bacterium]
MHWIIPVLLTAQAAAPTVNDIVARHIEARGGYERIKAIQTMKITRTVVTQFAELEVVILRKRPQSMRVEQTAPGQPPVLRAVTPDAAWDFAGGRLTNRTAQAAAETRELDADFDGLLVDWKDKGHTVELAGRETLPGADAFKLVVKTKNGATRTIYLDASTYLERRQIGSMTLPPDRKANVEIDVLGYKEAGGVKFPADIQEERTGAGPVQTIVVYTKAIEVNVPIDDAIFAPPAPPAAPGAGAAARKLADRLW